MDSRVKLFLDRFVNRTDVQCRQIVENESVVWRLVRKPLTEEDVLSHFSGAIRLGLYSSVESTTKFLTVDIDSKDRNVVSKVMDRIKSLGICFHLVDSGNKGYHCHVLFAKPMANRIARSIGARITKEHEVFPKQDYIEKGSFGNLIGAPMGVHQKTKNRVEFITHDFKPIQDQWDYLANVKTFDPAEKTKATPSVSPLPPSLNSAVAPDSPTPPLPPPPAPSSSSAQSFVKQCPIIIKPDWKPCILDLIAFGCESGKRNKSGHAIASEAKRLGKSKNEILGILTAWNLRNKPPLPESELSSIVNSAYSGKFQYGCKKNGILRSELVNCPGTYNCGFFEKGK